MPSPINASPLATSSAPLHMGTAWAQPAAEPAADQNCAAALGVLPSAAILSRASNAAGAPGGQATQLIWQRPRGMTSSGQELTNLLVTMLFYSFFFLGTLTSHPATLSIKY